MMSFPGANLNRSILEVEKSRKGTKKVVSMVRKLQKKLEEIENFGTENIEFEDVLVIDNEISVADEDYLGLENHMK